ncbi:alpha/beta hydrolase [Streptomyces sp. NPDC005438]|uniref:alpha/beta hydrolase n=1 Tax=Streptomyces sp. NPDC005438 TaxID=3156880 RepID=UPI0033B6FED6
MRVGRPHGRERRNGNRRGVRGRQRHLWVASLVTVTSLPLSGTSQAATPAPPPPRLPPLSARTLTDHYLAARQSARDAAEMALHHGDRARAHALRQLGSPQRQLLTLDARGPGRVVEVLGDLVNARHVAVLVPGADTTLDNYDPPADEPNPAKTLGGAARSLQREMSRQSPDTPSAVVAWLGYDTPSTLSPQVATTRRADEGARALVDQVTALRRVIPHAHLSLLGHSYGAVVCGRAAKNLPHPSHPTPSPGRSERTVPGTSTTGVEHVGTAVLGTLATRVPDTSATKAGTSQERHPNTSTTRAAMPDASATRAGSGGSAVLGTLATGYGKQANGGGDTPVAPTTKAGTTGTAVPGTSATSHAPSVGPTTGRGNPVERGLVQGPSPRAAHPQPASASRGPAIDEGPPRVTSAGLVDVIMYGSPGAGVSDASAMGSGVRVWAGRGNHDWIAHIPHVGPDLWGTGLGLGPDPVHPSFGARRFDAGNAHHSDYLVPGGAALRHIAWIAGGHPGNGRSAQSG